MKTGVTAWLAEALGASPRNCKGADAENEDPALPGSHGHAMLGLTFGRRLVLSASALGVWELFQKSCTVVRGKEWSGIPCPTLPYPTLPYPVPPAHECEGVH